MHVRAAHLEVRGEVEDGPGPAVDDLAGELLVLAQLLRVLVQVHHRLPDAGLLDPGINMTVGSYRYKIIKCSQENIVFL